MGWMLIVAMRGRWHPGWKRHLDNFGSGLRLCGSYLENTMLSCQSCFPCHSDADAPSESRRRHTPPCDRGSEPRSHLLQPQFLYYAPEGALFIVIQLILGPKDGNSLRSWNLCLPRHSNSGLVHQ